nr:hypothetical protein [Butyrivibrio sp.]
MFIDSIKNPSREFTAIPFWFLNGDLNEAEIRRQLVDFNTHGINGVVLHPRMGLSDKIEYLSEEFFYYIKYAVEVCDELNMTVVLYDEGMYPSGSAGGLIVKENPELASVGITVTDTLKTDDILICEKDLNNSSEKNMYKGFFENNE